MAVPALPDHPAWRRAASASAVLRAAGIEAWIVGGAVRDLLLGRPCHDVDVACAAPPERVQELFPRTVAVGRAFGVVRALLDGGEVEIASFRRDGLYVDGRRPQGVTLGASRDEDAARRDFTINALYLDPAGGELADPTGGRADLAGRILRGIGDPAARLTEDRLRVLRALRFAAVLGFAIEPQTLAAVRATAVDGVSRERVMDELGKALDGGGGAGFLRGAAATGHLAAVCPPLAAAPAAARERAAAALARLPPSAGQTAALVAWCLPLDAAVAGGWLESEPGPRSRARAVAALLAGLARWPQAGLAERRRLLRDAQAPALVALARAAWDAAAAEELAAAHKSERTHEHRPFLKANDLIVLGVNPGPGLGRILAAVEDAQLAGGVADRAAAEALALRLAHGGADGAPAR